MRRSIRTAVAALSPMLCTAILSGCSEAPSGSVASTLQVSLTSPFNDDGAVLFTVSGGPVDSLEADGLTAYSSRPNATTLRVILLGDLSSGTIARLHISDERLASQYSISLNQAAARATYAQRDPAAYHLSMTP